MPRTRRSRTIWETSRGNSGYFQRTIVRYTEVKHEGYRTLSCVADSSRSPPASNLPALYLFFWYGAYLYVDPRFCLRLPSAATLLHQPCLRLSFPSVRVDLDFVRYLCQNTGHHHLAAGPSPAHIGIGRSLATPPSHPTQHTGPYCASRLIRQVQIQGNKSPSDSK